MHALPAACDPPLSMAPSVSTQQLPLVRRAQQNPCNSVLDMAATATYVYSLSGTPQYNPTPASVKPGPTHADPDPGARTQTQCAAKTTAIQVSMRPHQHPVRAATATTPTPAAQVSQRSPSQLGIGLLTNGECCKHT